MWPWTLTILPSHPRTVIIVERKSHQAYYSTKPSPSVHKVGPGCCVADYWPSLSVDLESFSTAEFVTADRVLFIVRRPVQRCQTHTQARDRHSSKCLRLHCARTTAELIMGENRQRCRQVMFATVRLVKSPLHCTCADGARVIHLTQVHVNTYATRRSFSGGFWRPLTLTFDLMGCKLVNR